MGTVYHARPCGRLIEINSSLRRKNVSFTNIQCLSSNFIECKFFLELSSLILALCEANLDHSIHFSNFSVRGYLLLILKGSITATNGLAVYVPKGLFLHRTYL